jgi:Flp pilus assembly protein TadG
MQACRATSPNRRPLGRGSERGQGLVEFALIGPLFFLFVVLIVQGALYFNAQATIDNMTRETARAVAICGSSTTPWYYQNDNAANAQPYTSCVAAAQAQEQRTTYSFLPNQTSLSVYWCAAPATGHCTHGPTPTITAGEVLEVDTSYVYTFWVDPLMGSGGPTANITSSARVVAQQ